MKQGDIIKATITEVNNDGEGVVRVGEERFVLFVPNALPGEETELRVVTKKNRYGTAKVLKRFNDSLERIEPVCKSFGRCGGCTLQHMDYDAQLRLKRKSVTDALERIGKIESPFVAECRPSHENIGYRNKASMPVQRLRNEGLAAGFYRPRSHEIVQYCDCPVLMKKSRAMLPELISALRKAGFAGIREGKRSAGAELIREIVLREARFTDDIVCAIVTARKPNKSEIAKLADIARKIGGLTGMSVNINDAPGNFIWGSKNIPIYGKQTITERLGKYKFTFEASSFFQINSAQALNLYEKAARLALAEEPEKILELYSGIGSLTIFLASGGAQVTAVEEWQPAAKYIPINAEQNGAKRITAYTAKAEDIVERFADEKFDAVVLDPPRAGCDVRVIESLIKISSPRIVYVSCNPATLARDVKRLTEGGYMLVSATPFDMFPQTGHVETVCLLSKLNTKQNIEAVFA